MTEVAVPPEIVATDRLAALIVAERAAGVVPDGVRRLAALLPRDAALAEQVAARLRLSKADRKRLTLDAVPEEAEAAQALAYRDGAAVAIDRLLLADRAADAASLAGWAQPRFPLTGGQLIARGLAAGPEVARTLKAIEAQWVAEGFPPAARLGTLIGQALDQAKV
jgi:poly(A) polymerase